MIGTAAITLTVASFLALPLRLAPVVAHPGSGDDGGTDLAVSAQAASAVPVAPMAGGVSPCRSEVTSTVSASNIRVCDTVSVTVRMQTHCPVCSSGFNVVFVEVGESEHPEWAIGESLDALDVLVRLADAIVLRGSAVRVGVVHYAFTGSHAVPKIVLPLTESLKRAAGPIRENAGNQQLHNGPTSAAARAAVNMILAARRDQPPEDGEDLLGCNSIILLTSQRKNPEDQRRVPSLVRTAQISLFVGCPSGTPRWCEVPRDLPITSSYYSEYNERGKIAKNLEAEIEAVLNNARVRDVSLTQQLPAGLAYIDGSANVPPNTITTDTTTGATTLAWDWPRIGAATPPTITYRAKPVAEGLWQIGGSSKVVDVQNHIRELPLPSQAITVSGLCLPTATPPPTPTARSTPTALPSPTLPASPTTTPRPTVTPRPQAVYLPLLLRESCTPEQRRVDVALVLDASQSMLEPAAPGSPQTKLDAALNAARAFLDALRLDQGDQAAIVSFNSRAILLTGLTGDRPVLNAALSAIMSSPQTCIVCGLDTGARELAGPRRQSGNLPVLILLTDGRSNPQPASEAVARAAAAKAAGIRLYTIGLGADLDEAALREMVSGEGAIFHAPSGAELAGIYREIAVDIPCPSGAFWGGR